VWWNASVRWLWPVLACAACGGGDDPGVARAATAQSAAEATIARGLAAQLGVAIDRVSCNGVRCTAHVAGGGELAIAVHGKDWSIDGLAIASAPLEQYLSAALADLGVAARPDCGPRVRAARIGDRIECRLGDAGRAWATIRDAGGAFSIELALGPDAVAARTAPTDESALDRASAALATGSGDESDDEPAPPIDAGVAPP
jgi:hypothetical protein